MFGAWRKRNSWQIRVTWYLPVGRKISTRMAAEGTGHTEKFKPCVASFSFFSPNSYTSMLYISKIASILQTDVFTNINKCSSYNTMNSFPHTIFPPAPIPFKAKSKAPWQKGTQSRRFMEADLNVWGGMLSGQRREEVSTGYGTKGCIQREMKADRHEDSFLEGRNLFPKDEPVHNKPLLLQSPTGVGSTSPQDPGRGISSLPSGLTYKTKGMRETTQTTHSISNRDSHSGGSQNPSLHGEPPHPGTLEPKMPSWMPPAEQEWNANLSLRSRRSVQSLILLPVLDWLTLRALTLSSGRALGPRPALCLLSVASFHTALGLVNLARSKWEVSFKHRSASWRNRVIKARTQFTC